MPEEAAAVVAADLWMPAAAEAVSAGTVALVSEASIGAFSMGSIVSNMFSPAQLARSAAGFAFNALIGAAFSPKPRASSMQQARAQGALINAVSNVEPIPTPYGTVRVGGSRILTEVTGDSKQYLHVVVLWGEGEIAGLQQLYLDGHPVSDSKYSGLVTTEHYTGTDAQAASAALTAAIPTKWSVNHTVSGVAYTYLRLTYDGTAFPTGLPNVTADLDGRRLYDPRTGSTTFSHNPALAIRDWLTNTRYGRGVAASMIDDTAFSSAASHCEERVTAPTHTAAFTADASTDECIFTATETFGRGDGITVSTTGALPTGLAAATTYYVIPTLDGRVKLATSYANALARAAIDLTDAGSGTHTMTHVDLPRYTLDGLVNPDDAPLDTLRAMLTACRGYLVFSGGQYKLRCDRTTAATSFTLNEDNILGAWSFAMSSKRTRFNRVKAKFFDPSQSWQPSLAIQESAAFRTTDNGLLLESQIDLPFTANYYRAGQIAQVEMKQSRFGIVVSLTATIAATQLEVGDVVPLTHTTPGWVAKNFRVIEIELLNSDEVRLTLREYDASVYTLDAIAVVNTRPSTTLPDPSVVATPGAPAVVESLYSTTDSAGVKSRATVSWTAPADIFVAEYLVEYKAAAASTWTRLPLTKGTSINLDDTTPGSYNFRVKAFNTLGAASAYSDTTTKELLGLTAAPADLTGFTISKVGGLALAIWTLPTDLDVQINGAVVVRHSMQTSGATWENGVVMKEFPGNLVSGFLDLVTGTYLVKARDSSGNYSANAASFVVTEGMVSGFTTVASTDQAALGFTGAKTNVANTGSSIQLDGTTLIDSMATSIDSWAYIDSLGGISATGSYAFDTYLDLTTVATRRFESDIQVTSFDSGDLIDDRTALIDDWNSIDGTVINDCTVTLFARTTNDDPAGAPTWTSWAPYRVADFTCRAIQHRLDFASGNAQHNIKVSTLKVDVKTPVSP